MWFFIQVNGVNLLRLHSEHPYGYALTLLDTLFTREEQFQCLMFKSKKSDKPALDPIRVEKILGEFHCITLVRSKEGVELHVIAFGKLNTVIYTTCLIHVCIRVMQQQFA